MTEARKRELERTVSIIVFVLLTLAPIFVRSQYPFFVLCLAVINGIARHGP